MVFGTAVTAEKKLKNKKLKKQFMQYDFKNQYREINRTTNKNHFIIERKYHGRTEQ